MTKLLAYVGLGLINSLTQKLQSNPSPETQRSDKRNNKHRNRPDTGAVSVKAPKLRSTRSMYISACNKDMLIIIQREKENIRGLPP
ncbi:hypothetical protein BJX99DRAFT_218559 [Aspergillus californicus]